MPFRTIETLESWVAEFEQQNSAGASHIRVIPQDGDGGADTGLVGMRLPNSPTEIYIEPPTRPGEEWTVTFEPREDYVRLGAVAVQAIAVEMTKLARLCAFLQQKSDEFMRDFQRDPHLSTR
jgi:hypothetical protein